MNQEIKPIYVSPNQKIITCNTSHTEVPQEDGFIKAVNQLSGNAFKLYSYIARNQNGYTFALSGKEIKFVTGMGGKAYTNAVHELIVKGYLVQDQLWENHYSFYAQGKE